MQTVCSSLNCSKAQCAGLADRLYPYKNTLWTGDGVQGDSDIYKTALGSYGYGVLGVLTISSHPVSFEGVKNADWEELGTRLRNSRMG
jgi:hypothetical protein